MSVCCLCLAGASRCAPGFYSAKGSRKPCQQCPFGRTTEDLASKQRYITECIVKPGFGVVNSTDNATDPWNPTPGGDILPVLECPVGEFARWVLGNWLCPSASSAGSDYSCVGIAGASWDDLQWDDLQTADVWYRAPSQTASNAAGTIKFFTTMCSKSCCCLHWCYVCRLLWRWGRLQLKVHPLPCRVNYPGYRRSQRHRVQRLHCWLRHAG